MAEARKPTYEELLERVQQLEAALAQERECSRNLRDWLKSINSEADWMRLEGYQYVVTTDDPVWIEIAGEVTQWAHGSAKLAVRLSSHDLGRKKTERIASNEESDNTENSTKVPKRPAQAIAEATAFLKKMEAENPVSDEYSQALENNCATPTSSAEKETHRGRRNNIDELHEFGSKKEAVQKPCECPYCHHKKLKEIEDLGLLHDKLKALYDKLQEQSGGAKEVNIHGYFCQKCNDFFAHRPNNEDHPICCGRTIGVHSLLSISYLNYRGLAINAAGKDFELGAKLGSDTVSRSIHELSLHYFGKLFLSLEDILRLEWVIGADETPFDVKALGGKGYILSVGTPERSENRIELYKLLPNRTAVSIAVALALYQFKVLVADGYGGYNKTLSVMYMCS